MNSSRYKRRTLVDIYRLYPYKKNIVTSGNTVPLPFVKSSEVTDTKVSCDWIEWSEIVSLYIEKLKIHLEEGNTIELAPRSGEFKLSKLKITRLIDKVRSGKEGRTVKIFKNNVDNYFICSKWTKSKANIKLSSYWRIRLNKSWLARMYKDCEKDYTKIYKLR